MTAIIMRNKFTKLLTCVQLMITLVSFVSPAPANIPSDLKKEWMSNLCHFPPVDLYFEVPADDQQSLKKCVNNLKSEEERIPLCDKFVKSLNNNTCKKKVYEKELIISTLKKSNATEIKKYCNGLLSSSFKNKECEEVCTEDKFTKDMCLLIYFAKNITETALQVSSSTPKTTAATPPTSTEDCPSGSEYNPETKVCDDCLRGYYRNKTDPQQVKCQKCPDQFITVGTKATSVKNCTIKDCPSGSEYNPETKVCDDCLRGYYRNKTDPQQVKCQKCPDQFITVGTKATSVKNCTIKDCPSGSEYNPETKVCDDCLRGYYRNKTDPQQVKCQKCPDQFITVGTKATSVKNCTIKDCPSGSEYNPETKVCDDCLRGYYRNKTDPQQVKCQKCPDQFITVGTKAISKKNCTIKDCPSGSEYNPETQVCDDCLRGYYRNKTDPQQVKCQKCPDQFITVGTKATSVKNCTIKEDCPSGSEYNPETKDCDDCPRGYYRNKTDPQQVKCQKCPDQFITVGTKATSVKNCTIRKGNETKSLTTGNLTGQTNPSPEDCPSGSEYNPETKVCDDCLRGYYRNKTDLNQVKCQKCPDQFITVGTKAISKKNCTIKDCPSGSEYNPETKVCDDCLRGYYRNKTDPQQVKCQKCPDQFITVGTKATSVKNCTIKDCPSGSEYNPETKVCDDCLRGYYRNKTDPQQVKCQKCPDQFITVGTKATSVKNCTISKDGGVRNSQNGEGNSKNVDDHNNNPTNQNANKSPNKDANKNPDLSSLVPESEPEGHFMAYFLTAVVLCVAGYVIFHNKQKIVAFIIEGRTGRRSSRRPSKDGYSKVKTDDVMPSLEKSTTSKSYIY